MPKLLAQYIATGKAQLTFVPFSFIGDESFAATEAALCANDQGTFWAMHETIYANHNGENIGNLSGDRLKQMAEASRLDVERFAACMDAGTHRKEAQRSRTDPPQAGIVFTPAFVINGSDPVSYGSWGEFSAQIDAALAASALSTPASR